MKPEYEQIKLEGLDLHIDESKSIVCPFCNATHEKSCSITKVNGGLLFICFRAKCGEHGFIGSSSVSTVKKKHKEFKPRYFTRPLKFLTDRDMDKIWKLYGLTDREIERNGWRIDSKLDRLYLPILTEDGYEAGGISKRWEDTGNLPKILTYFWSPLYNLHFPKTDVMDGPVVVVEDIISSVKVARYARAVSLLGTHMNEEQAGRLHKLSTNGRGGCGGDIILALDSDTWKNGSSIAHRFKKDFGLMFRNFSIVKLSKDPKVMTDNNIKEVIFSAIREDNTKRNIV